MSEKYRTWWMSLSIRRKTNLFVGMIVAAVVALCVFSLSAIYINMRDFDAILGDSYFVNDSLVCFENENDAFIACSESKSEQNLVLYHTAKEQTKQALAQLVPDYRQNSLERYLITQAIQTSYRYYSAECDRLIDFPAMGTAYANQYYDTLDVAAYISGYFQELMKETLDEGTASYSRKVRAMRLLPVVSVSLAMLVLFLAALLGAMMIRHIVQPVIKLAESAGRIAENELDAPDVCVENRDEIGRLVETFNKMKGSMREYILALQEFNAMESRLHQEELKKVEMAQRLKAMQLSILQSQINPHFLFNTLGTIRSTAKIEGARYTEELIQRLSSLFRYNLQTSDAIVPLSRELNIIEDYIYIQRRRFGLRLRFVLDCRVDPDQVFIPAFTLQPLVENAIIHGVSLKEEGGGIRVRIVEKDGFIQVRITDTGLGISRENLSALLGQDMAQRGHLSHIGVGNVKSRLKMLFPHSRFKISSHVGLGTQICIAITAEKEGASVV